MIFKLVKFVSYQAMKLLYKKDTCPDVLFIKENIPYTEDGLQAHMLDIIYPAKKRDTYPFIINIHGGAFAMNSKNMLYRNYGMRLAGNEYAVINMNYRLSPQNIYPAQIEDVLSAIGFYYAQ